MSNEFYNEIKKHYADSFESRWGSEVITVAWQDLTSPHLIGKSNVESILAEYEWAHEDYWPYVHVACVYADMVRDDEELAETVLEILQGLENYPIFNEDDYYNREWEELERIKEEELAGDMTLHNDLTEEQNKAWLVANWETIDDYRFGSVDDAPYDTRELARLATEALATA